MPPLAAPLPPPPWTTRFAPAPTGYLHLGHVANAVWVWGLARAHGGRVVLRVEDHDRVRSRPEYEAALLEDLEWLGLAPDLGSPAELRAGPSPFRQSDRPAAYEAALRDLAGRGLVYPCACTRRRIAERTGPPLPGEELRYPGTCREGGVDPAATPVRRIRLERQEVPFTDLRLGPRTQVPADQCGDLLARDRDGHWTYQFAVVVDDLGSGLRLHGGGVPRIDLVIRGEDLLESTGRQIQLARLLDRPDPPAFLHHPLLLRPDGTKLSKSNRDTGVRDLRAAGWTPARVLGEAAFRSGLLDRPGKVTAEDLARLFPRGTTEKLAPTPAAPRPPPA